jgi:hypothetical protein
MALMRRLAEGAAASGDVRSAAEAVRVCMAEAETLYQLAMAERENALALARQATEELQRARSLREEAAGAGRERSATNPPAHDAPGSDLRPDPRGTRTPAGFIEALRQFRTWAGNPSYRDMSRACNGRPAASTICRVLGKRELPARFEVIDAIITACGGGEEDRARFATAWRRLIMSDQVILSDQEAAPVPGQIRAFPPAARLSPHPGHDLPDGSRLTSLSRCPPEQSLSPSHRRRRLTRSVTVVRTSSGT